MIRQIKEELLSLGIDSNLIINFLKHECKLDLGFEAQLFGIKAKSATTTGLIIYVLAFLKELDENEFRSIHTEIEQFRIKNGNFEDTYGTSFSCSWATSQIILAMMETNVDKARIKKLLDNFIERFLLEKGNWCFSGPDDAKIVYSIYPIIALVKAKAKYSLTYDDAIKRTQEYLFKYEPHYETEKVIVYGLLHLIDKRYFNKSVENIFIQINYLKLIKEEFGIYGTNEFTIYPFSMKVYTPALYLLCRYFIPPDNLEY